MNNSSLFLKIFFALILLLLGCSSQQKQEGKIAVPVTTVAIRQEKVAIPIRSSGLLSAGTEMRLSFKIAGIVESVYADEGASVKKGQLLAQLNQSEIQAQYQQAKSVFEKAERDLERVKNLYRDSVATLEQKQNAETGLSTAESNLQVAEFNLKHSKITAPATGRVLKRFTEENEMASAGQPIFLFGSRKTGWVVKVGVTDREVVKLALGDSANVVFDAYPGVAFPASLTEIAGASDPRSGTFEVELTLKNSPKPLSSGFVARAEILPTTGKTIRLIPVAALIEPNGEDGFVFTLVNDSTVRKVPIKIGGIIDDQVMVTTGLDSVQQVVSQGAPYLSENSKVRIVIPE